MLYIGSVLWHKQDKILKKGFLPLIRESKTKQYPSNIWHLKFSSLSFAKFAICAKKKKKTFLLMSGL